MVTKSKFQISRMGLDIASWLQSQFILQSNLHEDESVVENIFCVMVIGWKYNEK